MADEITPRQIDDLERLLGKLWGDCRIPVALRDRAADLLKDIRLERLAAGQPKDTITVFPCDRCRKPISLATGYAEYECGAVRVCLECDNRMGDEPRIPT